MKNFAGPNSKDANFELIRLAFVFLLGREPEDPNVYENFKDITNEWELRKRLIRSREFFEKTKQLVDGRSAEVDNTEQLLINLHVPKTAGSSLNRLLAESFITKFTSDGNTLKAFAKLPAEQREAISAVFGHGEVGFERHTNRNCVYIICLRDPASRLFSYYNYVLNTVDHPLHTTIKNIKFGTFVDLLHKKKYRELDNIYVRTLIGQKENPDKMGYEEYAKALAFLSGNRVVFGLQERYGKFVTRLFDRKMVSKNMEYSENVLNANSAFDSAMNELTSHQKRRLNEAIRWDRKLYEFAEAVDSSLT